MKFRFNNIILFSIKVSGCNRIELVTVARWERGRPARHERVTAKKDAPGGTFAGGTPALPALHFSLFTFKLSVHLFVQFSTREPGGSLPMNNTPPDITTHDLLFTIHQLLFL
ncbi:MAG TPA: hypothetical protein VM866_01770 [Pyrinomonadaceae bacterium]|jgi:hypothetical protein|nr:hypothetical protein [Pyrinomonadaceae bacterium]